MGEEDAKVRLYYPDLEFRKIPSVRYGPTDDSVIGNSACGHQMVKSVGSRTGRSSSGSQLGFPAECFSGRQALRGGIGPVKRR